MSNIFHVIFVQPLFNLLIWITSLLPGHSVGWAIVVLTIIIRLVLWPSVASGLKQQRKLQELQPELKKVQEQYKDDKEAQARETMALYQKYNIHPLGSCLPLLIQLPLILALVRVFNQGINTSHFNELYSFVPHLDSLNATFLGIDLSRPDRFFVLPILAGVLQYFQSRMMIQVTPSTPDNPTQNILNTQMLYFMPALTVLISYSLPAALPLYWVVTTLFAIGQQAYLYRDVPKPVRMAPTVSKTEAIEKTAEPKNQTEKHGSVSVTVRKKG